MMKKLLLGVGLAALIAAALHLHSIQNDFLLKAMPITMGMFKPTVLAFSYRNTYSDTASATTYNFTSSDLGTPHGTRLVAVGISSTGSTTVSSVTVDGTAGTQVQTAGTDARRIDLWRASSTANSTGTIAVTFAAGVTGCIIHVWVGYPSSAVPVDSVAASGTTSPTVIADLAKTSGGFAVFVIRLNSTPTSLALTGTGAETITENYKAAFDAAQQTAAYSFVVTTTTTTDDYTNTMGADFGNSLIGATWA